MWQACAVCGYPLERIFDGPTEGWGHARDLYDAPDHIAVPVDAHEITVNARCDFCNGAPVTEVLWCTSFDLPGGHSRSVGHWAMCTGCAPLVRRRRYSQLATRVRSLSAIVAGFPRKQLDDLYALVDSHRVEQITVEEWNSRPERFGPPEEE